MSTQNHKEVTIGRFTLYYNWIDDFEIGGEIWHCTKPPEMDDSPESIHLEEVEDGLRCIDWDEEYADELIAALAKNPFKASSD